MKKAIYAFSGDPITYGHIDIIRRAARIFDQVVVGIGVNPNKQYMFTLEQRTEMAKKSLEIFPGVRVVSFRGMLVDYAYEHGIPVIIKGVRNVQDFDYEVVLHYLSDSQKLDIDTYMLPARQELSHISSSAAKALQQEQGLTHDYVPLFVKMCLEAKMSSQYIVGVTGEIGVGKSFIAEKLVSIGREKGIPVYHIELDHIGHAIHSMLKEPIYNTVRNEIENKFGSSVRLPDGSINRKVLGEIVFNDPLKMDELNRLMYAPLLVRLRRELYAKKGIILFNAALIAESNMASLSNNNFILVTADRESQIRRIKARNLTPEQIKKRLESQFNTHQKKEHLLKQINAASFGQMWIIDNSDNTDTNNIYTLFDDIVADLDIYGELRFKALWERLALKGKYENQYREITRAYSEPQRSYHTLAHITRGLEDFAGIRHLLVHPDEAEFAWWYHDIVWKPESAANEEESAQAAQIILSQSGIDEEAAHRIREIILCTKHEKNNSDEQCENPADGNYLADIDLAVLGKSRLEFDEYENKIRNEFFHVLENQYRQGRREFLSRLIEKKHIYHTEFFRNKYEVRARENINELIAQMSSEE